MKKGLLGSTAIVAATAMTAGMAQAAEAPTWKLSGFGNFQAYIVSQDASEFISTTINTANGGTTTGNVDIQDGGIYFGVDDAELTLNVSGTADNGLEYGLKIEFEGSPGGSNVADEARIQLSGSWGTIQMGDEDGAEDTMNYGGENLMGATGGFDGDQDDWYFNTGFATSFPNVAGDSSDHTKITYYSPRFSGLQVGASWTPSLDQDGDEFKVDGEYENHIGVGVNYDGSFGDVRIRVSGVYSLASHSDTAAKVLEFREDISAYSIGGIVGFGPFSVGANWTDNGDSGSVTAPFATAADPLIEDSAYWNVAAAWESGPIYLSVGYMSATAEKVGTAEDTYKHIAVTADYTIAPGLGVYAEFSSIESEFQVGAALPVSNDGTGVILGANVSF